MKETEKCADQYAQNIVTEILVILGFSATKRIPGIAAVHVSLRANYNFKYEM